MKHLTKLFRATIAIAIMLCVALPTFAHDFEVNGIYYDYLDKTAKTVKVTYRGDSYNSYSNEYTGAVSIPSSVTYYSTTYSVTSIGSSAFEGCSGLTSVTIPNSVTSIGASAFYNCTGLTSVTIPSSVTSIGSGAFKYCSGLTELNYNAENCTSMGSSSNPVFNNCSNLKTVNIGSSVKSIPSYAFSGCSGLTSITIPNSVTSIGEGAFSSCTGLTSITIPNSVTSIDSDAFSYCIRLTSIVVEKGNTKYDSRDNCNAIIETATNTLMSGCKNTTIPNSVTSIGDKAFLGCTRLTSVSIPNSVTSIGSYAFYYCTGLTEVSIGNSVTSIGDGAFRSCSGLTSVTIPNSVTSIGDWAFGDCTGLTSVTIPNSVTSIGDSSFSSCSGLTSITIPNSVTSIGEAAFFNCTGLTSVTIPNSVTTIAYGAFSGCDGLTSITIPNSVTSIGYWAFAYCDGLTEVYFNAENCTSMGSYDYPVFNGCTKLKTLNIGNSVKTIPANAFYKCDGLTSVTIADGNDAISCGTLFGNVTKIDNLYIGRQFKSSVTATPFKNNTSLKSVTLTGGITDIASGEFYGCSNLNSLTIGSGILTIGKNAATPTKTIWLTNTPPSGYEYAQGIVNYVSNDLYTELIDKTVYPYLSSMFEVDGVMYVPVSPSERTCDALDCTYENNIDSINIGKTVSYKGIAMNVKNINHYTFYRNNYLTDLTIDSLFAGTIGNHAVWGCKNLKGIDIPNLVTEVGANCFEQCDSLKFAIIGNSVPAINDNTFAGCYSLTDITIPKNVASVGNYAFDGCKAMTNVFIADRNTILELGSNGNEPMFSDCPLDSVYIGGNISYSYADSRGYSPFYRNTSLRAVKITDKETEVSENEFYGCTNLKYVSIGNGVESIGNWAFSGCSSLDYFAFGTSMKTIGEEAFSDCTAVTKLYSQASTPPVCGTQALDDINKWTCELYVPGESIPAYQAADQWKEFFFMYDGVEGVEMDNNAIEIARYDIHGRLLSKPARGFNIVIYSDGTTRKEIVK